MVIKSIELADYRNYEQLDLKFDKRINILYGDNAQGKTNILEAIYLAATTKSHQGQQGQGDHKFSEGGGPYQDLPGKGRRGDQGGYAP